MNYFDGNTPIAKFASGCEQSQLRYRDYMYYDRAYNDGYGPYVAASNAAAASVQPLKFGGKELERRGGLEIARKCGCGQRPLHHAGPQA